MEKFNWKSYAKNFISNWILSRHAFDDVNRVKIHFQSSTRPMYLRICSSFLFILPLGRLIFLWIAHTMADIIHIQLDAQKHLHIES